MPGRLDLVVLLSEGGVVVFEAGYAAVPGKKGRGR